MLQLIKTSVTLQTAYLRGLQNFVTDVTLVTHFSYIYIYIFFIEKNIFFQKKIFFKTYKIRKFICNNRYTTYLSHLQVLQQPLQSVTFTVTNRYNRYKSGWSSETKIKFLNFCELRFYL